MASAPRDGSPRVGGGLAVEPAASTRRLDGGRLLVGGSPTTVMRLSGSFVRTLSTTRLGARMLATGLGVPCLGDITPATLDHITVIVPVKDRPEQLVRCLSSLDGANVIVVDDASKDPDLTRQIAYRHGARLVELSRNLGPAEARNSGLNYVQTELVACVDSDVTVTAESLLALTRHFADDAVALVAPRIRETAGVEGHWFRRYAAAASSLDLGPESAEVIPGSAVAYVPSACFVARTSDVASGFDRRLRVGEDVDLVWRLIRRGRRVRYDASQVAYHDARVTFAQWLSREATYGSSAAELARRHGNWVAPLVVTPLTAGTVAAMVARPPVAAVVSTAAVTRSYFRVAKVLGARRRRVAVALTAQGAGASVDAVSATVVRHWWPGLTAAGGAVSVVATMTRGRVAASLRARLTRLLIVSLLGDSLTACRAELCRRKSGDEPIGLPIVLLGRQLQNLAYGAGVWAGVASTRTVTALVPRGVGGDRMRRSRHFNLKTIDYSESGYEEPTCLKPSSSQRYEPR